MHALGRLVDFVSQRFEANSGVDEVTQDRLGFEALADEIHKPAKSVHRMLSRSGNPTMRNISAVFAAIKRALNVEIRMEVVMA